MELIKYASYREGVSKLIKYVSESKYAAWFDCAEAYVDHTKLAKEIHYAMSGDEECAQFINDLSTQCALLGDKRAKEMREMAKTTFRPATTKWDDMVMDSRMASIEAIVALATSTLKTM